jgi:hypothetical protein
MDAILLANVALEVAEYYPDIDNDIPRAEWRWNTLELAAEIIDARRLSRHTEDIDEIVQGYLSEKESLS